MNTKTLSLAVLTLCLSACGGFQLNPTTPSNAHPLSEVRVSLSPALDADKQEAIAAYAIPEHMRAALSASYPQGGELTMEVMISEFRTGAFGPTRMHADARLVDAGGQVVAQAEADSSTMRGGTRAKIQRVSQELIDQLVAAL